MFGGPKGVILTSNADLATRCKTGVGADKARWCETYVESARAGYFQALSKRAAVYRTLNRPRDAIGDDETILAVSPTEPLGLDGRAFAELDLGQVDAATKDFDNSVASNVKTASAYTARCWFRGVWLTSFDQAIADCDAGAALHIDSVRAASVRAVVEFRMGRYAQAMAEAESVLSKSPFDREATLVRGYARLRTGLPNEGRADIQAVRAADTDRRFVEKYAPAFNQPAGRPRAGIILGGTPHWVGTNAPGTQVELAGCDDAEGAERIQHCTALVKASADNYHAAASASEERSP